VRGTFLLDPTQGIEYLLNIETGTPLTTPQKAAKTMDTIKLEDIRFPTRAAAVKACLDTGLERVRTCPVSGDPIPARRGLFGRDGFFVSIYKNGPVYKLSNATPHFQWAKGSIGWSVEQDVREGLLRVLGAA